MGGSKRRKYADDDDDDDDDDYDDDGVVDVDVDVRASPVELHRDISQEPFGWEIAGKMPNATDTTSIEHPAELLLYEPLNVYCTNIYVSIVEQKHARSPDLPIQGVRLRLFGSALCAAPGSLRRGH